MRSQANIVLSEHVELLTEMEKSEPTKSKADAQNPKQTNPQAEHVGSSLRTACMNVEKPMCAALGAKVVSPRYAELCRNKTLPRLLKSETDTTNPSLTRLRANSGLPKVARSRANKGNSKQTVVRGDAALPRRLKP